MMLACTLALVLLGLAWVRWTLTEPPPVHVPVDGALDECVCGCAWPCPHLPPEEYGRLV